MAENPKGAKADDNRQHVASRRAAEAAKAAGKVVAWPGDLDDGKAVEITLAHRLKVAGTTYPQGTRMRVPTSLLVSEPNLDADSPDNIAVRQATESAAQLARSAPNLAFLRRAMAVAAGSRR